MKKAASIFLLLFVAYFSYAQQNYSTRNRTAIKYFVEGNHNLDNLAYDEAIANLRKAIEADAQFAEAHALLADIMRQRRFDPLSVIDEYKKVLAINPDFNRAIYINLAELEVGQAKYQEALQYLEKYLTYPGIQPKDKLRAEKLIKDCRFSINALSRPVAFNPINVGKAINTPADEYSPVITADEKTIIFTRQINANEDFYQSNKIDTNWQKASYLSERINTPNFNEGSESISPDGKYLFFTGCNRPDGMGRCDIYVVLKKGNDWDKPFNLGAPINTSGWESQPSISSDGRTLYFVSNRAGGYGGYDIWKSTLTNKGWGTPENLGPTVNTPYNEQSPFIHPDDSTLYFCSDGWPGMGGQDLFVSRLDNNGKWQEPENLGYPINSNGNETGLSLTARGDFAFFSSNKLNGAGGFDIYSFKMPPNFKPKPVTYVKGIVFDAKNKKPLESQVEIIALRDSKPVYQNYSSETDGDFLATLTSDKNYGLNISRKGYLFYSENFSLVGYKSDKPFNIQVPLQPIEIGSKVILKNIFFDTNKYDLKPESRGELQEMVNFLAYNPTVKVEISGHTDNVGNDALNQTLSENRAKSVYQFLISSKVDASRLEYKGYGKTQPVATNESEEGRSQNRRTEFKIIGK
ncbi:OmpA family protein [Mucilaginibacter auburnensis]|uniref:Outer membrane protein OmpA-like peptidoglycan-associated protein n=1 Tax=Mucilaginibacter auburnensis TaxID=1457233 RepID=A0A2H9VMI0_9SPHI|nr:OmpA family protein [Mucilaginibacter auburnensis]PJJ79524.1 outer membrane protein OmpA-like peptidoglycan-associated protein [Mucilaginibacter auburnensis]